MNNISLNKNQNTIVRVEETIPNRSTREALIEIADMRRHPERYKAYSDVEEMMKDLLS